MGFQVLAPVLPRGLLRVAKNSDFGFAKKSCFVSGMPEQAAEKVRAGIEIAADDPQQ